MKKMTTQLALTLILISSFSTPSHADLFGIWFKPKVSLVSGGGDVFQRFDGSPAGGAEAGLTLLGMSLWGDIEFMSSEQYWSSVNLGYKLSFGDKLRFTLGAYVGALWFAFPERGSSDGISAGMSSSLDSILSSAGIDDYSQFESTYNEAFEEFDAVSNNAFGLNGRARLELEYQFLPALSIGVQGLLGYHYIISGEEAAGSAKSLAIDSFVDGLPEGQIQTDISSLRDALKRELGAEDSELSDFQGLHYSVGLFLNFSY